MELKALAVFKIKYLATHMSTGRECEVDVDDLDTFPNLVDKWREDGWIVYTKIVPYDAPVYGKLIYPDSIVVHDNEGYEEINTLKNRISELTQDRDNWRAAATVAQDRARELSV